MGRPLSTEVSKNLGFFFDARLAKNLTWWRNAVLNQDIDFAMIVDGAEGSGKSVMGMQIAYFLDIEHQIDLKTQVCYYPEQFKTAVLSLKPGKAIIWDEARRGLNRRRSGGDVNLDITDLLAECRQHNLFLIIIMPSFYDMDMNVAVWRTRCLVHTWYNWDKDKPITPLQRGFFRFYNEAGKKRLYTNIELRKQYAYPYIHNCSFDRQFKEHYVVDEKEYRKLKKEAELAYRNKRENPRPKLENKELSIMERAKLLRFLNRNRFLKVGWRKATASFYQVTDKTIGNWLNSLSIDEEEGKKNKRGRGTTLIAESEKEDSPINEKSFDLDDLEENSDDLDDLEAK